MIKTLIEIGKCVRDLYPMPLVEVPYPLQKGRKEPKVLVVDLVSDPKGVIEVEKSSLFDYAPEDTYNRYFFRNPPAAQGQAASLSFKLPEKTSSLKQRLGILKSLGYRTDTDKLAKFIDGRVKDLKASGKLDKKAPVLIAIKIDGKWPAENERLKENFVKNFLNSIATYKKKPLWKKESICHGCGNRTVVYGGVGTLLKFYTVDKYGYAPELNPKIAWKQYGLCEECIFDLERGKRVVDDFLTWNFYGKAFWLLPVSTGDLRKIIDKFRNFQKELTGKAHKEEYEMLEDRILYEASIQKEAISYHLVFVQKDNQALRILLHIEEVLPSVLGQYVSIKKEVEDEFNDFVGEALPLKNKIFFNFFSSPTLRATPQKPGFNDKDFFSLVDKVFRQSPIDELYLISKAMSRISKEMVDSDERMGIPKLAVLETLLALIFLHRWGVLKRKIGGVKMDYLPYKDFFEKHRDFFNHPAKRGLVLLGVLTQNFLNEQYRRRQSTPFLKVLKNLRLDQKDVQRIFVALQNKMNEYEIGHWWPRLREGISLSFIEAGERWPLSPDEIGFYIAVGMALYSHPAFKENYETV